MEGPGSGLEHGRAARGGKRGSGPRPERATTRPPSTTGYHPAPEHLVLTSGRVRAGHRAGEALYGGLGDPAWHRALIHLIGERPGTGHHTFSAYITAPTVEVWSQPGRVDHNITRVVFGVALTAYSPTLAAPEAVRLLQQLVPAGR